eukprot:CAMPEP_0117655618 /NCGR_PEP_ID=MMETSP0804-20121206/4376_1 /TAXON_ID=1074897 /ORGANISM="Tetraselmis astigmatica, Strain CCMP880" /LENGTH=87 /DNA_ID=CAMNT_0005461983 /DNA_START=716 /DNA_END=979 /DNA_ORIENTATION=+
MWKILPDRGRHVTDGDAYPPPICAVDLRAVHQTDMVDGGLTWLQAGLNCISLWHVYSHLLALEQQAATPKLLSVVQLPSEVAAGPEA